MLINLFRHNSAVGEREELDRECRNLRENVDECTLTRVDLEEKNKIDTFFSSSRANFERLNQNQIDFMQNIRMEP